MKTQLLCLVLIVNGFAKTSTPINSIIGDISFVKKFGQNPTDFSDENTRIKVHLEYVETMLRKAAVSNLSPQLKARRMKMLDLLNEYHKRAIFPKNFDYKDERKPCFIDKTGAICAVGYLIEQTAGRNTAIAINQKYKYQFLMKMKGEKLENWIANSGLSKIECAMIQPGYDYYDNYYFRLKQSRYIIASNTAVSTLNGIQLAKKSTNKIVPIAGILTGVGQITYGIMTSSKYERYVRNPVPSLIVKRKKLSIFNIAMGSSTVLLSSWNLFSGKKPKEKKISWDIYNYNTSNGNEIGLNLTKKI